MTSIVALVFLVPLGMALQGETRELALEDAARQTAVVTGAVAVDADPAAVRRALDTTTGDDPAGRPVVHGLATGGTARARAADVDRVRRDARP
ncbi:MAG TPA: two-component sensor histidine kinase, partial [Micromonospora sp.]